MSKLAPRATVDTIVPATTKMENAVFAWETKLMQQSKGTIGHRKHRACKWPGTKYQKSGRTKMLIDRDELATTLERERIREAHKGRLYDSVHDLFDNEA